MPPINGPLIPSIGSIVILSTPFCCKEILGVAGFNSIFPPDTVELCKRDPVIDQPPIVPSNAVKTPLFTVKLPLLAEILPLVITLPVNVPLPVIESPPVRGALSIAVPCES